MFGFGKKKNTHAHGSFNSAKEKPVIVQSICTGEKTLCFIDRETRRKREVGLVKGDSDLASYAKEYGFDAKDVSTQW